MGGAGALQKGPTPCPSTHLLLSLHPHFIAIVQMWQNSWHNTCLSAIYKGVQQRAAADPAL